MRLRPKQTEVGDSHVAPRREPDISRQPFDYADYEFSMRDRQWNKEMLAPCVSHLRQCRNVVDLACGQGVLLELLAEHGISSFGVERNARVAAWVRSQGARVVCQDVFEFLAADSPETFDGAVCSHLLEHLGFDDVLRFIELLARRLEPGGTAVIIVPNPESIRMHLFGFWRDPEHVRFYHPELLEHVCRHYGLDVVHSNRADEPFALAPLPHAAESAAERLPARPIPAWRHAARRVYSRLLRALRLTSYADLRALEAAMRRERGVFEATVARWAHDATWAINRMWAWPDNALIVCRKRALEERS